MLLAGTALFFIERILPLLEHSKNKMLAIARMSMDWQANQLVSVLQQKHIAYDAETLQKIQTRLAQKQFYSTQEFFRLLKFNQVDDMDFNADEGCTIIHDLNQPIAAALHAHYDFVFENGTLEHIFDIKTAVANTALAVKPGGYILHVSPLDAFNHGFYNFSINFFADFYRVNGFKDQKFFLLRAASDWQQGKEDVLVEDIIYTHEEFQVDKNIYHTPYNKLGIAFCARKVEHIHPTRIPIQAAYDRSLQLTSRLNNW